MKILQQNDTDNTTIKGNVVILRHGRFHDEEGEDAFSKQQHNPFAEAVNAD